MARQFGFDEPRRLSPRRTQDWDFAARATDWDDYFRFLSALEKAGYRVNRDAGVAFHPTGTQFDLLPFSGVLETDGMIRHPGDPRSAMDGRFYEEAWRQHNHHTLAEDIRLSLPDVPSYVALKLVAWSERGFHKHAADVLHVLQHKDALS